MVSISIGMFSDGQLDVLSIIPILNYYGVPDSLLCTMSEPSGSSEEYGRNMAVLQEN